MQLEQIELNNRLPLSEYGIPTSPTRQLTVGKHGVESIELLDNGVIRVTITNYDCDIILPFSSVVRSSSVNEGRRKARLKAEAKTEADEQRAESERVKAEEKVAKEAAKAEQRAVDASRARAAEEAAEKEALQSEEATPRASTGLLRRSRKAKSSK